MTAAHDIKADGAEIRALMQDMGVAAKAAAQVLATATPDIKNAALHHAAEAIRARKGEILDANFDDVERADAKEVKNSFEMNSTST